MKGRHTLNKRAGLPAFTWDNRGPISSKWFQACNKAKDWWHEWQPKDSKGTLVKEDTFFHAMLEYCVMRTSFTGGKMTKGKLRTKFQDWRNGGAYVRDKEISSVLTRQADPIAKAVNRATPKDLPIAKKQRIESPVPEVNPLAYDYSDRSRLACRMRLYDNLINSSTASLPFSPNEVQKQELVAGEGEPTTMPKTPDTPVVVCSTHKAEDVLKSLQENQRVSTEKSTNATKSAAREWVDTGDCSLNTADAVLVELQDYNKEVADTEWERWMTYPKPKILEPNEEEEDDDDYDDSSVNSSEPEGEYLWSSKDISAEHPLHPIIDKTITPPSQSVTAKLQNLGVSAAPPIWNPYLIACGIEECLFKEKGGKTEAYHSYIKVIRAELKAKNSSLRTRLLRHVVSPEKITKLTTQEICSKFRKASVAL
eukprot:TRINITY_DN11940_c0_g1_i1.p1 TRINITY_DN11940_c0_g1~~TRINITY_DN11940_c0_g1_i1.p1  ORF type:complete len:424 (+),score=103.95 TRINITY_DN11940_c0_g1_i1:188-1459(+)